MDIQKCAGYCKNHELFPYDCPFAVHCSQPKPEGGHKIWYQASTDCPQWRQEKEQEIIDLQNEIDFDEERCARDKRYLGQMKAELGK